jgi:AcrR family transcriptional regulator
MALPDEVDGRRLRREHNREAVLDALAALFAEGIYWPNANQIAERAGLSPRSVFRYFDDIEDLHRAVIARELEAALRLVDLSVGPEAPTAEKIVAIADARVALYEAHHPAARAARALLYRGPVIGRQVHRSRAFLRHQIAELFAPELERRAELLPAIDALCSFETWDLMRTDNNLSRADTISALVTALSALLA